MFRSSLAVSENSEVIVYGAADPKGNISFAQDVEEVRKIKQNSLW
jgi:DNA integrity scanning protein DisA with diadenylate cyclase activity